MVIDLSSSLMNADAGTNANPLLETIRNIQEKCFVILKRYFNGITSSIIPFEGSNTYSLIFVINKQLDFTCKEIKIVFSERNAIIKIDILIPMNIQPSLLHGQLITTTLSLMNTACLEWNQKGSLYLRIEYADKFR